MAVHGLGGVGKTQVALEFAYRTKVRNPMCSVFWIPATNPSTFEQAYLHVGQKLKVPGIDANGADVKQMVKDALSHDKDIGPWLMIVDNADDYNVIFRQPTTDAIRGPALIDYIPFSLDGSVLFTTRNRKVAVSQAATNVILLEMMSPDDADRLLRRSLLSEEILNDSAVTAQLLSLLGFLPLAIIQAAAYINENDASVAEYLELYAGSEAEVMEILSENFEDQGRYRTIGNSIATTWLISFSQISRMSSLAIEYLSFMACLANQNIPQSLLLPAPTKKQSIEAIGALTAYSLISKRENEPAFDMHRLVHLATRNWLRKEALLDTWAGKAVDRMVELLPAGGHKNRAIWTAYLPHAKHLLSSLQDSEFEEKIIMLAEKLGECLYSNGRYSEAQVVLDRAIELRVKASGVDNAATLRNMFLRAEALSHRGKHKEAEIEHRHILELRKQYLGPKAPEVGRSMNYLAQAIYEDGRFVEAELIHREALAFQNEVLHAEHPNALTTTGYIAQILGKQGRYEEAELMHRELLKVRLRVQGEEYPATLATMSCLGVAQGDLGHFSDSEQTHRRVLGLRVRLLGDNHPHTLITKRWLADALVQQGKYDNAASLNHEVLNQQIDVLGTKHPNTILSFANLGDILFYQGQTDRAKAIYQQVLDLQKEVLGPEHPETFGGLTSLANVLYQERKYTEAKEMYEKVLDLRMKALGSEHPKTRATHMTLNEKFNALGLGNLTLDENHET